MFVSWFVSAFPSFVVCVCLQKRKSEHKLKGFDDTTYLNQHCCWILKMLSEVVQPFGSHCTVHCSMITTQGDSYIVALLESVKRHFCVTLSLRRQNKLNLPLFWFLINNTSFLCATNSQDTRLWWIDDGWEVRNSEHTQIGYTKSTSLEFSRLQFSVASFSCQGFYVLWNCSESLAVGSENNWCNQTTIRGDSYRYVNGIESMKGKFLVKVFEWKVCVRTV